MSALPEQRDNPSILIVEDEEPIRRLLAVSLERAGYDVSTSGNGAEALAMIDEAIPDLIISDIMMPEMSGLEMLTALRADTMTRGIPLILLTAKGETSDIVTGLELGADDYLAKPFKIGELQARVRAKLERPPVPVEHLVRDNRTNLVTARAFQDDLSRELLRARRSRDIGCLAYLEITELARIRERLGNRAEQTLVRKISELSVRDSRALDTVGRDDAGRFMLLLPETNAQGAKVRLRRLHNLIVRETFTAGGERLRLTPVSGFTVFDGEAGIETVKKQVLAALDHAALSLDLEPVQYLPGMVATGHGKSGAAPTAGLHWTRWRATTMLPFQIAAVHLLGVLIPFLVYVGLYKAGYNVVPAAYIAVVISLLVTGALIWLEGFAALEWREPPEPEGEPPPVTAIIAAYLPNEAPTIVDTVEAFLHVEYSGDYQIILAYNTPRDMPVESYLHRIARRDPRFTALRVVNSTSKAQNVNAALAEANGEIIGVFDADHHPAPDAFTRAWKWIASGFDIVQGHCVVRNGAESIVSRTAAVEFELIYAVSHPGRARLHDFGIFGGSNGYWRAELLRQTRMHGFMLTEDIDSSMRVVAAGKKICADPGLISRELAPVTLKALWNQRIRWAQGWFQVSRRHFLAAMKSPALGIRQKLGVFHLLWWREVYPWLSLQMWPIIAFLIWRANSARGVNWFVPVFVLTTIFTLSVGPGQVLFAYLLATPDVKLHRKWFWVFLLYSPFYSEFKNLIGRVAQIKELMGERQWKVTPRSASRSESPTGGSSGSAR